MTFVVRTVPDPAPMVPSLQARVWEIDPTLPVYDVATVDALVAQTLAARRFVMQLLGTLALLAFVLAAAGIYGVLRVSVAQRTHEIGVRMAMGAGPGPILRLVVGEGLTLVGAGVGLGLAGASATTRVLSASFYQVTATDPIAFAAATLLLVAVAAAACCLPARRAARVDPLAALRAE